MKALVAFESIYGNTRAVAEAIAEGLEPLGAVEVLSVDDAGDGAVEGADLLVVGGPTHMHGLSVSLSRIAARGIARRLRRRGYELVADSESFLVEDSEGPLAAGEVGRTVSGARRLPNT